jgi:beta-galactosidase
MHPNRPSRPIIHLAALALALSLAMPAPAAQAPAAPATTERLSLDHGWRFHEGDIPFPTIKGHGDSYNNAKAGKAWGAAAPEFDDSNWRLLDLPHDWAVEQAFDKNANLSQGYRARGFGWYRRSFKLDPADRGKALELQFDGIATHCTVWLNGTVVHRNWCGYTSFQIDLTPFANFGEHPNHIAVRVDAEAMEGWWYEGAGIYRHTWLVKQSPLHITTDGVFANPVRTTAGGWEIPVETTLANSGAEDASGEVRAVLLDPAGKPVAEAHATAQVPQLATAVAKLTLTVSQPKLWSVATPTLYTVRTSVACGGRPVDMLETRCGFRTIRFDADKGFFLNDVPMKLKGTCNHQDHAGVGVAVPDALWDFRIRRLKAMGSNAYRCAHNPPAKEFLDACDRLGMLVMDENRNFNVSAESTRELEWMVRRDRNHPSVILWSVFNEETTQGTEMGYQMVRRMTASVKRLDTTRPVTAAMNGGHKSPINVSQAVDVVGFNYNQNVYDEFHKAHPKLPITSSEDTSSFMTRDNYVTDGSKNLIGSYDDQRAPWGLTHRYAWRCIAERPFVAGGFVWTGFDYRGEPTPHGWPSAGSFFGIMDLCGFPKAAFYLHRAHWVDDQPVLHLIPHWNWPGKEGQKIKVMAFTNADTVTLVLNGKQLEEKKVDPIDMAEWEVPYAPGKLEAIGRKNGKEVSRCAVVTTGAPVALQITPDRKAMAGDGLDAMPVTISAVDAAGRPVPTANLMVGFETRGAGDIIGVGNGDPNSHEAEKCVDNGQAGGWRRSLFNGLAQVIVQSRRDGTGTLVLRATADGLKPAVCSLQVTPAAAPPAVESASGEVSLGTWMLSPLTKDAPDPNSKFADNDMNSWSRVQAGAPQDFTAGAWALLRCQFTPPAGIAKAGGRITFKEILGNAEVFIDGHSAGKKATPAAAALTVALPPGDGPRTLSVLVNSAGQPKAGLTGSVYVTPQ